MVVMMLMAVLEVMFVAVTEMRLVGLEMLVAMVDLARRHRRAGMTRGDGGAREAGRLAGAAAARLSRERAAGQRSTDECRNQTACQPRDHGAIVRLGFQKTNAFLREADGFSRGSGRAVCGAQKANSESGRSEPEPPTRTWKMKSG